MEAVLGAAFFVTFGGNFRMRVFSILVSVASVVSGIANSKITAETSRIQ